MVHKLVGHVAFAASTEESRPILNGVLWELRPDRMRMVATNGHRLAKMDVPASGGSTADLIVPPKALEQIRRLYPGDAEIELAKSDNHIGFRAGGTLVFSRLIEGPYPNYEQVIPRENDKHATVDKMAMAAALRRMSVVASDQTHRIRLAFSGGNVKFSVQTPDLGEAQDELTCSRSSSTCRPMRYASRSRRPSAPRRSNRSAGTILLPTWPSSCRYDL